MATTTSDLLSHCDLDLGGLSLTSLVVASLVATHNLIGHGLHVDRHLFFSSLLVAAVNDFFGHRGLNFCGLSLASLTVACNPLGCSPHVDCHLLSPPSWL